MVTVHQKERQAKHLQRRADRFAEEGGVVDHPKGGYQDQVCVLVLDELSNVVLTGERTNRESGVSKRGLKYPWQEH